MTVVKEEPGLWVAYCDQCGERVVLDADPDDEKALAIEELEEERDWRIEKDEKHRFKRGDRDGNYKQIYEQHFCPDC